MCKTKHNEIFYMFYCLIGPLFDENDHIKDSGSLFNYPYNYVRLYLDIILSTTLF